MALYHLDWSHVSRGDGGSACATFAYISGEKVFDERLGKTFKYGREERIQLVEGKTARVRLPECADRSFEDAERLVNAIELAEKASDARTAVKVIVALPREFTSQQRVEALDAFVGEQFVARRYAAVYAIHEDEDGVNPHAHILVPNRQFDEATGQFARTKTRKEYVRDEAGNKVPVIDPATGQQKIRRRKGHGEEKVWQRRSVQVNPLDEKATLEAARAGWADVANRYLEPDDRISHLSLEAQGLARTPTVHEGYAARAIEARGGKSPVMELNRQIRAENRRRDEQAEAIIADATDVWDDMAIAIAEFTGRLGEAASLRETADLFDEQAAKFVEMGRRLGYTDYDGRWLYNRADHLQRTANYLRRLDERDYVRALVPTCPGVRWPRPNDTIGNFIRLWQDTKAAKRFAEEVAFAIAELKKLDAKQEAHIAELKAEDERRRALIAGEPLAARKPETTNLIHRNNFVVSDDARGEDAEAAGMPQEAPFAAGTLGLNAAPLGEALAQEAAPDATAAVHSDGNGRKPRRRR